MKRISLLFHVRKTKSLANGTAPIYIRISVGTVRLELAAKRNVDPLKWNAVSQKIMGFTEEAKTINAYLKALEQSIYNTYHQLIQEGKEITPDLLKNKFTGKKESGKMLIEIFKDHNDRVRLLVGQEYAAGTFQRVSNLPKTYNQLFTMEIPKNGY